MNHQYARYDPRNLRKDWLVSIITSAISGIFHEFYQVDYKNVERLEKLREKPFFLVSNHQSLLDIPLAEIPVRDVLDRYLFFVMKSSLPSFMRYLGGINVTRDPDIKDRLMEARDKDGLDDKQGRYLKKALVKLASRMKDNLYEKILPELMASGEAITIYPEGSRFHGTTLIDTGFPRANLRKMLEVQERAQTLKQDPSFQVPFLPLYIQYLPLRKPGSKIVVEVGEPKTFANDDLEGLCRHLVEHIKSFRLSQQ